MEDTTTNLVSVLNDLIHINYDRIEGYRKAAEESKTYDIQLHPLFQKMADESRKNVSALTEQVKLHGGKAESGSTALGSIYHAWMDVKATFAGKDRASILSACEYGEDQAQKAYKDALASNAEINAETRKVITSQQETLKNSHDEIRKLRDVSKTN